MPPAFSLLLTHHRRPATLDRLLHYLFTDCAASLAGGELIVIDDRSEHSSAAEIICRNHQERFQHVGIPFHSHFLPENAGPSGARRAGLHLAQGRYVQFLDDDDWIAPGKIPHQLAWAEAHGDSDLIASPWARVAATATCGESTPISTHLPEFTPPEPLAVLETFTPLMACLIRRTVLLEVDAFAEGYRLVEDVHLQLKLIATGARLQVAPSGAPLFFYRSSASGESLSTAEDRLPFLHACRRNVELAEELLRSRGPLEADSLRRLASLYGQLARGLFASDRPGFERLLAHMRELEPGYLPEGPAALRMASRLIGYRQAEHLSHLVRRGKRLLGGRT